MKTQRNDTRRTAAAVLSLVMVLFLATAAFAQTTSGGPETRVDSALHLNDVTWDGTQYVAGPGLEIQTGRAALATAVLAAMGERGRDARVLSAGGEDVEPQETVATGMQIEGYSVPGTQTPLVVEGDVTGSGQMNLTQVTRMAEAYRDHDMLTGAYLLAADWTGTGNVGLTDLVMEAELYSATEDADDAQIPAPETWMTPALPDVPQGIADNFAEALDAESSAQTYSPIAWIGYQVVNGYNYLMLCEQPIAGSDDTARYALVSLSVNRDLADPSILQTEPSPCEVPNYDPSLMGGWREPEDGPAVPQSLAEAIEQADSTLRPLAVAAQQVVSGMNYLTCCERSDRYYMVQVYVPVNGEAEITEQSGFGIGANWPDPTPPPSTAPSPSPSAGAQPSSVPSVEDWVVPADPTVSQDVRTDFENAVGLPEGVTFELEACVGVREGYGTDYLLLTESTGYDGIAEPRYGLLTLHVNARRTQSVVPRFAVSDYAVPDFGTSSSGWVVPRGAPAVSAEAAQALQSAQTARAEGDAGLTAVAELGRQAGNGTSYLLCCADADSYLLLLVHEATGGTAELEDSQLLTEGAGRLSVSSSPGITAELQELYDGASDVPEDADYKPVACLGQEAGNGLDYYLLCEVSTNAVGADDFYGLLTMYTTPTKDFAMITAVRTSTCTVPVYLDKPGAWHLSADWPDVPDAVLTAFGDLSLSSAYTPVACLGEQITRGATYLMCILHDSDREFQMAQILVSLEEEAELRNVVGFTDPYTTSEPTPGSSASPTGTVSAAPTPTQTATPTPVPTPDPAKWTIPESVAVTTDIANLFARASGRPENARTEPVACVGTRVNDGTDYLLLCEVSPNTGEDIATYWLLTMHAGGTSSAPRITDTERTDCVVPSFNEVPGAWVVPAGAPLVTQTAANAVDNATDGECEALALLGEQTLNGTNYLVFCAFTYYDAYTMLKIHVDAGGQGASVFESSPI